MKFVHQTRGNSEHRLVLRVGETGDQVLIDWIDGAQDYLAQVGEMFGPQVDEEEVLEERGTSPFLPGRLRQGNAGMGPSPLRQERHHGRL